MNPLLFLEQLLNGLQFGFMLFLMAAGLTLVFGIMNLVNFAHGSIYMIGRFSAPGPMLRPVPTCSRSLPLGARWRWGSRSR